jgi:hypothetical protein
MPNTSGFDGIDKETNEQFHWKVQRVRLFCGLVTGLVLFAALMGFLGAGPISNVEVTGPDSSLHVRYPRFARMEAPIELVFNAQPVENKIEIEIANQYLARFEIEGISPEPAETRVGLEYTSYIFQSSAGERGPVRMQVRAREFGTISGTVRAGGGPAITLRQFVYP